MSFTIVSLGGPVATEGEAMLRAAGTRLVSTGSYPAKAEICALLAAEQPDAIIVRLVERIDGEILRASPRLRLVARHGAGSNNVDVVAAAALGIPVLAAVGANAHSVAEHALSLMLALAKDLRSQDSFVRSGGWKDKAYAGFELRGLTLGLVGLGLIGSTFAAMVQPLGMRVIAYDPYAPETAFGAGVTRATELDALLSASDVVSLHCPLTPATEQLIGARQLGLMKRSALLINTARGEVVDEAALIAALRDGTIAGAGLDSFAPEPPAPDNALWSLPNVILSPHVAGVTAEARREVSLMTCRNVLAWLRGEEVARRFFVQPG